MLTDTNTIFCISMCWTPPKREREREQTIHAEAMHNGKPNGSKIMRPTVATTDAACKSC